MGAAGDMLAAALYELLPDKNGILEKLNTLGLPGVTFGVSKTSKCGITGTHFEVLVDGHAEGGEHQHEEGHSGHTHSHSEEYSGNAYSHEECRAQHTHSHIEGHSEHVHSHHEENKDHVHTHSHRSYKDVIHVVEDHLDLDKNIKANILNVYKLIGEAESKVHDTDIEHIHFHEVGTLDAIADVTSVCVFINELKPDRIVVSPVRVGKGTVKCAHGILPIPAPATAEIIKGMPVYAGDIEGEMCTPTGAALIKHFADEFGSMPEMTIDSIGYGMGTKDFGTANCVRAVLGEGNNSVDSEQVRKSEYIEQSKQDDQIDHLNKGDYINQISCNIDDMTGEDIGTAIDILYEGGAAEVYTIPVSTKKNRPAVILEVLCSDEALERIIQLIFKHTSTIGIRKQRLERCILDRRIEEVETEYWIIRKKICTGYGVTKEKFEHDDLVKTAKTAGLSVAELKTAIQTDLSRDSVSETGTKTFK